MTSTISKNLLLGTSLVLGLALTAFTPAAAWSAKPAKAMAMSESEMKEHCKVMIAEKQEMIDAMKAQDALLTAQVEEMNKAPESKKVGLMAALLTHVVEQRISMDVRKGKMEEHMVKHMEEHMSMGKGAKKCSLMGGTKDKEEDEKEEKSEKKDKD